MFTYCKTTAVRASAWTAIMLRISGSVWVDGLISRKLSILCFIRAFDNEKLQNSTFIKYIHNNTSNNFNLSGSNPLKYIWNK